MGPSKDEFTTAELKTALTLVMSDSEADDLISSWISDGIGSEAIGSGYTGDTLALLSLLSDDLRSRVDAYIRRSGGDHEMWLERRRELKAVLKPETDQDSSS